MNSMLCSETERAEDSTYVQAETEKPNKFPQEEGAHHSIPLIILFFLAGKNVFEAEWVSMMKRNKNCSVVIDLRNAASVRLENVKDIETSNYASDFEFKKMYRRIEMAQFSCLGGTGG